MRASRCTLPTDQARGLQSLGLVRPEQKRVNRSTLFRMIGNVLRLMRAATIQAPMPDATIPQAMRWAREMIVAGRPAQAVLVCRQIIQQQPQNAEAHLDLGTALLQMGNLDDAEASS